MEGLKSATRLAMFLAMVAPLGCRKPQPAAAARTVSVSSKTLAALSEATRFTPETTCVCRLSPATTIPSGVTTEMQRLIAGGWAGLRGLGAAGSFRGLVG